MKITPKILSVPPYISTSWRDVASLHTESKDADFLLVVTLVNGFQVEIPHLEPSILELIFAMHAKFLEQDSAPAYPTKKPDEKNLHIGIPLPFEISGIENLGALLQHNPEAANTPDLPPEVLTKVASLSKAIGMEDPANMPKGEPHCNCFYCQIARAMQGEIKESPAVLVQEEEVSPEDLKFRAWDVHQTAEKLYTVTNPLDNHERYNVYLGAPLGCTCGEKNCEHIRAVLNS